MKLLFFYFRKPLASSGANPVLTNTAVNSTPLRESNVPPQTPTSRYKKN
jgi:hypothetical protein